MIVVDELINRVKIKTLIQVIKKNIKLIEMKHNNFESNVTFGRTLSLGQWFGLYLGLEIANELKDYEVLIDTCITTLKKYPTKNVNSKRMIRKSRYLDILIVKKVSGDLSNYTDFIEENTKVIKKNNLKNIPTINLYDAEAVIEVKIDPGYIKIDDLETSFEVLNGYLDSKEEFSFKKIYKKDEENDFSLKSIIRFNSPNINKYLVLATEANHSERVPEIKKTCKDKKYNYIPLTNDKIHIRDLKISDIPNLKNLI